MQIFDVSDTGKIIAVVVTFLFILTLCPLQARAWTSEDGKFSASGFVEAYTREHSEEEGNLSEISPMVVNFQWQSTKRTKVLWEIESAHAPRTQAEHWFGDKKVVEGDVDFSKRMFIDHDIEGAGNLRFGKFYRRLGYWISTDWTYYSPTYTRPNIPNFGLVVPNSVGAMYYDDYRINENMLLNYSLSLYRPGWNNTDRVFKADSDTSTEIPEGELGESYLISTNLDLYRNYNLGAAYYFVKDRTDEISFPDDPFIPPLLGGEHVFPDTVPARDVSTEFHGLGLEWLQFFAQAKNLLDGNLKLRTEYAVIQTNAEEGAALKSFDGVTHHSFYADAEYDLAPRWSIYGRFGTGADLPRGFRSRSETYIDDTELKMNEYAAALHWRPSPGLQIRLEHSRFDWDVNKADHVYPTGPSPVKRDDYHLTQLTVGQIF